jgi:curved DNA-binding protein CbpA
MSAFPDYYALLNIPKTATYDEIRTAYKKESLKYIHPLLMAFLLPTITHLRNHRTHPDRLSNATVAEKKQATEKFQVFDLPY